MTTSSKFKISDDEPIYIVSNGIAFDKGTLVELWIKNSSGYDCYGLVGGEQSLKCFTAAYALSLGTICPDWDLGI